MARPMPDAPAVTSTRKPSGSAKTSLIMNRFHSSGRKIRPLTIAPRPALGFTGKCSSSKLAPPDINSSDRQSASHRTRRDQFLHSAEVARQNAKPRHSDDAYSTAIGLPGEPVAPTIGKGANM